MKSMFHKYLINLAVFMLVIIAIAAVFVYFFKLIPAFIPFIILLFFILNSTFHYFLLKKSSLPGAAFTNIYMISAFVKMLVSVIIILASVLLCKENKIGTILSITVIYFLFTGFEIISLLRTLKKDNKTTLK